MKTILTLVCFVSFTLMPCISLAVEPPWSTTFKCPEWVQRKTPGVACDGLVLDWGAACVSGNCTQITSAANNPSGLGGKGIRFWVGDGGNIHSGPVRVLFDSPQTELWVRWYMRYEAGYKWSTLIYDKWLYFRSVAGTGNSAIPEFNNGNGISIIAGGTPNYYQVHNPNAGWQSIYGTQSDGSWFCVEIHIKMDTNGTDGVGEIWINGNKVAQNYSVNWSNGNGAARQGWLWYDFDNNQASPSNGKVMYVDWDDMVVSKTGYIGPIK